MFISSCKLLLIRQVVLFFMISEVAAGDLYVRVEDCIELLGLVPKDVRERYSPTPIDRIPDTALDCWKRLRAFPPEPVPLRSKLRSGVEGLPADVTLKFVETTENVDGIDVKFEPQGESNWAELRKVEVTVASRLFDQLYMDNLSCAIAACYGGGAHTITIKCGL